MMRSTVVAALALGLGFVLGAIAMGENSGGLSELTSRVGTGARHAAMKAVAGAVAGEDARMRLLLEYPELIDRIQAGGGFGGHFSREIGQNIFSRKPEAIDDALEMTTITEVAPRTWLIRMPIVNAALFETDEGLVLVDVGTGPGGPAVVEAMRKVSKAPLHTVIYTHGHVDHAHGAWALEEAGETPVQIIAQENIRGRFQRYIDLRGSLARYMSQPRDQVPARSEDHVWPTRTFADRLELEIGGETFVLQHHKGETDDQLYVFVPGRGALASADYYQGFLPNAGNGKRVQRHVKEWIHALREMADLNPSVLLPAHGEAITDPKEIRESFLLHADALEHIREHTVAALNRGLRKDQVFQSLEWPDRFAGDPRLNIQYVTPQDISKMVMKRYTGWWDDIPSNWSPARVEAQANAIVRLAGGMGPFVGFIREIAKTDIQLACHFTDWAFFADPADKQAQALVLEIYRKRILDPASNTQEILAYVDHMTAVRLLQVGGEIEPR